MTEGDLAWCGQHTMQRTDDVLEHCTPETHVILLTNVTPINSIQIRSKQRAKQMSK